MSNTSGWSSGNVPSPQTVVAGRSTRAYNVDVNLDIGNILRDWPYEPDKISARLIQGADGQEKIQVRLDLGLLQMETTGRPDGTRPFGVDSLLDYYERRLQQYRAEYGTDEGFELDESECELLRAEGVMYYHRYLAEFVLEHFDAVMRDTRRNLRLMDFCGAYAKEESDRQALEQYRSYVLMMYTRARALRAFRENRPRAALAAIRRGIAQIREARRKMGDLSDDMHAHSGEIEILRAMEKELARQLPVAPEDQLRAELSRAVKEERYEDAASIRDKLRELTGEAIPPRD